MVKLKAYYNVFIFFLVLTLAAYVIYLMLWKLLGHSPLFEEVQLMLTGTLLAGAFAIYHRQGKCSEFMAHTEKELDYHRHEFTEIRNELKILRNDVQEIKHEIKSLKTE